MSEIEHIPVDQVEVVDEPLSLFDEYNLRLVDLGCGPALLTPEGQSIFGGHIRSQKASHIASIFGYLIDQRLSDAPVTEPVTVVEIDTSSMDNDPAWVIHTGMVRAFDYLGIEGLSHIDVPLHEVGGDDNLTIVREVQLPGGQFVSTHSQGRLIKVLLTPDSVLQSQ